MSAVQDYFPAVASASVKGDPRDAETRTWSEISGFLQETQRTVTLTEHRHEEHELVAVLRGTLSVQSPLGSWTVGPGAAVWMPATIPHVVTIAAESVLQGAYIAPSVLSAVPRWDLPHAIDTDEVLTGLLVRLRQPDLADDWRGRASAVFLDVLEESSVSTTSLPLPRDRRALSVAEALLDQPADTRELRDWAEQLGVSTKTLARAFLADTGLTFTAWRARAHGQRPHPLARRVCRRRGRPRRGLRQHLRVHRRVPRSRGCQSRRVRPGTAVAAIPSLVCPVLWATAPRRADRTGHTAAGGRPRRVREG